MAIKQLTFRCYDKPDIPVQKAYTFSKSTKNQRIEAWWEKLTTGQTNQWKQLFEWYNETGFFTGSEIDKMALCFLYIEPI